MRIDTLQTAINPAAPSAIRIADDTEVRARSVAVIGRIDYVIGEQDLSEAIPIQNLACGPELICIHRHREARQPFRGVDDSGRIGIGLFWLQGCIAPSPDAFRWLERVVP